MISRFLLALGLSVLMLVTGITSYMYLGAKQSKVAAPPQKPTAATPRAQAFTLSGTLYLEQSGALYSFSAGRFHQLTPEDGWMQPSLYPDQTHLLAVRKRPLFSDVYSLTRYGGIVRQLTTNDAPGNQDTGARHWAFYPRLSLDQLTMFISYDQPKYEGSYNVLMSVWGIPSNGEVRSGRVWTYPNDYTGGDMQPVPMPSGGIIYTKYSYSGDNFGLVGQLWYTNRPGAAGTPLTTPQEDCGQPALSPDGHQLAMICSYQKQASHLMIAPWYGESIGPRETIIDSQLVAQPTWAPDGSGIAYLAPAAPDGPFQLWFLPQVAYNPPAPSPTPTPTPGGPYRGTLPSPSPVAPPPLQIVKPIQVTTNLGFDASSPMAWAS